MEFLRIFARTLKLPENKDMLTGLMGDNTGSFSSYTTSLSEQFNSMSEDELIEWFYNILFKERAQIEIVISDDYSPTIIYKETPKNYTWTYIIGGYLFLVAAVGLILLINRKRLYY
jgi:hypothetical protein